jgi:hypothetical protein
MRADERERSQDNSSVETTADDDDSLSSRIMLWLFDHGLLVGEAPRQTHKGHYQNEKSSQGRRRAKGGISYPDYTPI